MAILGTLPISTAKAYLVPYSTVGFSGYSIKGVVKIGTSGVSRRVVLLNRNTLGYTASTYSKPDGSFVFKNLPEPMGIDFYIVLVLDDQQVYNAEVVDFVKPVLLTGGA